MTSGCHPARAQRVSGAVVLAAWVARRTWRVVLLIASSQLLGAQSHRPTALDSLAAATASSTVRYADRRVAAADGYRRLGADFPGMGEHWLHPGALLSGKLDATRPTILIYATIGGEPALLGVGSVTTTQGDGASNAAPGWPQAWHEHSGLVSDESGVSPGTSAPSDKHVWVLHVWTRLANPDGVYTPDNWALPFVRAQLVAPERADADAARALSLLSGGDDYLRGLLTDARMRTPANEAAVDAVLAAVRSRVASVVTAPRVAPSLSVNELASLRSEWQAMSASLRALLGSSVDALLAPPHARMAGAHLHHSDVGSAGSLPRVP